MTDKQIQTLKELLRLHQEAEVGSDDRKGKSAQLVAYLAGCLDGYQDTDEKPKHDHVGEERDVSVPAKSEPDARGKRTKTCSYCHTPGHMPKTCPKKRVDDRAHEGSKPTEREFLTEKEYHEVKDCQKDDLNSVQCASEMNVPIMEVNKAYLSPSYDWYRKH